MDNLEAIPGPRGLPFLGNLLDMRDEEAPLRALERLAEMYGPIYQINIGGKRQIVVSAADLMKEVMDEKKFMKTAIPGLHGKCDGLIIAGTDDPDWEQAHRILRPAFGPIKIEDMFDDMKDIAHQLVMKWARFGSDSPIEITEDLSNLTLDTIALCTMNYRFNSFYRDGMHPYVAAMSTTLAAAGARQAKIPVVSTAMSFIGAGGGGITEQQNAEAVAFMRKTAQEIIDYRRSNPSTQHDFLDDLLFGKDPKTGQAMRDELIAAEMQTFLVAGHETTSGMLSFAIMYLLQNPDTYRRAQQEVDQVVGYRAVSLQHIRDLKYIYAVLQETLRLVPTAPTIGKVPHPRLQGQILTLGGKYKVEPTDRIRILLGKSMQDPKVFGEDAREFKPERMLESNPEYKMFEKYWRPFSEGMRACVGRPFSIQEAMLVMALVLQNFDLRLSDPMYKLRIKHTITIKPLGLEITASLRHGMTPLDLERRLHDGDDGSQKKSATTTMENGVLSGESGPPLRILYGSNTGTCQALAQRLAAEAASVYGFLPVVEEMDAAVENITKTSPTIIITASYEGEPPDNALQFVKHLQILSGTELKNVKYAVFGCGNKDWHSTFHRIPKLVDEIYKARGGDMIAELGVSDVSRGNPMSDFETWLDNTLLPELKKLSPKAAETLDADNIPEIEADVSTGDRVAILHQDLQVGTVKDVKALTAPGEQPEKRHMEVELPPQATYECGDYLAILPQSPEANIRGVLSHFRLPNDATIVLKSRIFSLPLNTPLSVADLLRNYFELAKPATRRAISLSLKHTKDEATREQLSTWLTDEDHFQQQITDKKLSVLDLLRKFPVIDMPFPTFLSMLPPLSIRQYSISSSPLRNAGTCTISYSVLTGEKTPDTPFYGVATTFLSTLKPGDKIQVATRRTAKPTFRLPLDAENTPLLMFAAGTGFAPFRGFIEQRAIQLAANPNAKLAPAHLFLGCRSATRDRLYADLVDEWSQAGAVNVYYSFSREPEQSENCKYVPDRMMKEAATIAAAWQAGARAYVCGNRAFAQSVGAAARTIVEEKLAMRKGEEGWTTAEVEKRKAAIFATFGERAADDVFD